MADDCGLWVDLEIEYFGTCQATVETQGIKLPSKDGQEQADIEQVSEQLAAFDSDEEDSAEEDDDITDGNYKGFEDSAYSISDKGQNGSSTQPCGFRARVLESLLKSDILAKVARLIGLKKILWDKYYSPTTASISKGNPYTQFPT